MAFHAMAQCRRAGSQKASTASDEQIREGFLTERAGLHHRGRRGRRQVADLPQSTGAANPRKCWSLRCPRYHPELCEEADKSLHSTVKGLWIPPKRDEEPSQGPTFTVRPIGHTRVVCLIIHLCGLRRIPLLQDPRCLLRHLMTKTGAS